MKQSINSEIFKIAIIAFGLTFFYLLLYKIYIPHTNSFGCFDDCMNISAGYFLQYGRTLYSEIFFNHQPILAYLSFFVQTATNPQNLYELLLRHIQTVLLWSFLFNILIVYRFRFAGILFVIIFELSKYYLFGYKFLAESFIVYPMVYMAGLVLYKYLNKSIYDIEYLLGPMFTWFIIFSREPFIPSSLIMLALLIGIPKTKIKKISVLTLIVISSISLLFLPFDEYLYSITSLNYDAIIKNEAEESGLLGVITSIFYPIIIFLKGQINDLRILQIGISSVFIISILLLIKNKKYIITFLILLILGLSNIRAVDPGTLFYQAFRMIPWFGMFLLISLILLGEVKVKNKFLKPILVSVVFVSLIIFVLYPGNYITKTVDQQFELITNFGQTIQVGESVRILSSPDHTFFINQNDSLVLSYWQSQRNSSYKYGVFGYVQPGFKKYQREKENMILYSPPDFYFGDLNITSDKEKQNEINNSYRLILKESDTTGLFIKKSIINSISDEKWQRAEGFEVVRPN
ncbi:MAG: hypothetical protein A3A51_05035 [Candidatus Levybacteria bacterium RIFCSPLOWO2_01_FULL_39_10]|nr:MAG: hypothetical protein A3A51_05035 [Candidatus Levybacteria bacterium RIFCSPLOWO2_01_FULL_39_10]